MKVDTDEIFVSHDVVSLFAKIPIDVTLKIVQDHLRTDRTLKKRTNLTVEDISRLLQFVAKSTYFQFKGTIYRQKEAFAAGDPMSTIMSGFFMEDYEAKARSKTPQGVSLMCSLLRSVWGWLRRKHAGVIRLLITLSGCVSLTEKFNLV